MWTFAVYYHLIKRWEIRYCSDTSLRLSSHNALGEETTSVGNEAP